MCMHIPTVKKCTGSDLVCAHTITIKASDRAIQSRSQELQIQNTERRKINSTK